MKPLCSFRVSAVLCLLASSVLIFAAPPSWWVDPSAPIIDEEATADNYAPANLGQLKNLAKKAKLHLDANLAGEAGAPIDALVDSFEPRSGQGYTQPQIDAFIAENYAPINLGQLKAVAKPFYDRLHSAGYDTKANLITRGFSDKWTGPGAWTGYYPWSPSTPVAENYAPANLGQLKMVFSFDLNGFDADLDGLPDAWEMEFFGDLNAGLDDDTDGDGLTNGQEFAQGSNPDNYYNRGSTTIVPVISITGGNDQTGPVEEVLEAALQVEVRDGPAGPVLENAPVVFTVTAGGGLLSEESNEVTGMSPLTVRTDSSGVAQVYLRQGAALFATNTVTAQAASSPSVTFQSQTVPREALWGYWRFNETSGTIADDSSELGNDGTLVNAPQWSPRYSGEGGILFSGAMGEGGSDASVSMGSPSNGSLDFGTDNFSIAVWVKFSETSTLSGSSGRRIVSKGAHDADSGYFIGLMGDGKINAGLGSTLSTPATESLLFKTTQEFDDNAWHQVVVIFDQDNATAKIYVDGVAQALENDANGGGMVDVLDGTLLTYAALENLSATNELVPLTVGSHEGTADFFKGGVDDLRLYRKALTAAEVLALYQNEGVLTALAENVSVEEDALGSFVLKNTGGGIDAPSYQIVTPPLHGEAILGGDTISYYPNAHYNGSDSIRFSVEKGGRVAEADLTITVTAVNDPPLVSVGGALSVTMPNSITVTGAVSDIDTSPGNIGLSWRKVSGPGDVTFSTPSALTSTVTFGAPGQYVLRLTADDGEIVRGDSLVVTVNPEEAVDLPTISLSSPVNNATQGFALPFALKASASAGAGQTVAGVEFYEGSRKIGEALAPDSVSGLYELNWTPPRLGVYAITAIVTTNTGLTASSNMRQVVVSEDGWFSGSGMIAGNDGYAGSGGSGGIASGSTSGPSSSTYQNGQNGGTETAGGGGNGSGGARDDMSLDSDGDGLSDFEEKKLGSDPHAKKSDDDDLEDGIDADPVDSVVNWTRVPDSEYTVVSLGSVATNASFLSIGNKGDVLMGVGGAIRYWKEGVWSTLGAGSREVLGSGNGVILDSDAIIVSTSSRIVGDTYMAAHALKWTSPSNSAVSLSDTPEEYLGVSYDYVRYNNSVHLGVGSGKSILYKYYFNNNEMLMSVPPYKTDTIESLVLEGVTLTRRVTHKAPDPWYEVEQEGDDYDFHQFYITRSGHSYVFKTVNGIRRNLLYIEGGGSPLDITTELSNVGYRSESPNGDPLISSASLSKILQSGEWKATKDYLGTVNFRGEGLRYNPNTARKELWRNGRVQDIEKLCPGYKAEEIELVESNDKGAIFAYMGTGVERKPALLVPVELKDLKKTADENDDVYIETIEPKQASETENDYIQRPLRDKQIAFIEPHGATNNIDPEMPHLVAKLAGPHGLKVKWRLEVDYQRGNGWRASYVNQALHKDEDKVLIPTTSGTGAPVFTGEMDADAEWRIFEAGDWIDQIAQKGFFGGTAKLFLWIPSQSETAPTEPIMTFRIGGKNPDADKAKTFIQSHLSDNRLWFAYAIAKKESAGYEKAFYNQFFGSYRKRDGNEYDQNKDWQCWAKGWPAYNIDRASRNGPMTSAGGYGVFQVTGDAQNQWTMIPRRQIWNWQDNVGYQENGKWKGAMGILKVKIQFVDARYNALQNTYTACGSIPNFPTGGSPARKPFSGWDAYVCKGYNGFGGTLPKVKINGYKDNQWSPWHPFSSYWKFIDDGYTPAVWSNVEESN